MCLPAHKSFLPLFTLQRLSHISPCVGHSLSLSLCSLSAVDPRYLQGRFFPPDSSILFAVRLKVLFLLCRRIPEDRPLHHRLATRLIIHHRRLRPPDTSSTIGYRLYIISIRPGHRLSSSNRSSRRLINR